jgi:multiple sugar transport system permease protein
MELTIKRSLKDLKKPGQFFGTRRGRETASFFLFISPWLVGFFCLSVIPLGLGLLASFSNYDGLNLPSIKFVGLNQYERTFADPEFYFSLKRTFIFTAVSVPLSLILSFGIATLLNGKVFGREFFRTAWYLPSILPIVAAAWVWKLFGSTNTGLLNSLISLVHPGTALQWLRQYGTYTLVAYSLWTGAGYGMVIFLAGLQGIPRELLEAAIIDGANRWHTFFSVTLPLMTPVLFFQLIMGTIGALQIMQEAMLLAETGAGMQRVTEVPRANYMLMVHIYGTAFFQNNMAFGIAMLWILFVLILMLTLLIFRSSRYWVYYEVD